MAGGDPMGDLLPNEVVRASFGNGRLRLTNLRLRYRGERLRHRESFEMQAASLTAVGVVRRYSVHLWILLFPLVAMLLGLLVAITVGDGDPLLGAFFLAAFGTPLLVVGSWTLAPVYAIRVVGGGYAWHVAAPRARLQEAAGFVREVSALIAAEGEGERSQVEVPAFTSRPFGR